MKVRPDIAELLRAGTPQAHIARQLHVSQLTVQRAREALGLPARKAGPPSAATIEDAFATHTEAAVDGHVRWTGSTDQYGTPRLGFRDGSSTAYRVAFRLHHRREPVGRVRPGCDMQGCVAGAHMEDQPMRQQTNALFTAIFGKPTA